jgi:hypothetical protein
LSSQLLLATLRLVVGWEETRLDIAVVEKRSLTARASSRRPVALDNQVRHVAKGSSPRLQLSNLNLAIRPVDARGGGAHNAISVIRVGQGAFKRQQVPRRRGSTLSP